MAAYFFDNLLDEKSGLVMTKPLFLLKNERGAGVFAYGRIPVSARLVHRRYGHEKTMKRP